MNELQVWNYNEHEIRTVTKDGEPWFVAKDVTDVLELDSTAARRVDEVDKGVHSVQTPGGLQPMVIVNESGMYSLVLGSRKVEAMAFKRWVTGTVLPSIRKHGSYILPSSKNVYGILRGLVDDLERQDQQIAAVNLRVDKIAQGIPALPVPANAQEEYVTPTQLGKMFAVRDICKIRDGGQCVVCQTTSFLQASHIFPKGLYKAMRWLTPNIEIRCAGDHKFKPGSPHADPAMCGEWWRKHLDKKRWQYLMKASQTITQVNPWFRDSEYERLKVEYLALTGQEWKRK
jgi:hypothetical protein